MPGGSMAMEQQNQCSVSASGRAVLLREAECPAGWWGGQVPGEADELGLYRVDCFLLAHMLRKRFAWAESFLQLTSCLSCAHKGSLLLGELVTICLPKRQSC